jgi:DNA repair exonuclease SbcCD ATPase subunit
MAANKKSTDARSTSSTVTRELDQLRKKVKELTLKLEREVKARKLDARLAAETKKAREQMTREIKTLREQARKLTSQLKSTLGDAIKRDQALKEARAKVVELKLELGRKTAELRRKSGELRKLAEESAHRAAAIIRADAQHATEPVEAEPAASPALSEAGSESPPGRRANSNLAALDEYVLFDCRRRIFPAVCASAWSTRADANNSRPARQRCAAQPSLPPSRPVRLTFVIR